MKFGDSPFCTTKETDMPALDHYPHAITTHGECTLHQAIMQHEQIIAIKDSDGLIHPPTDDDLQFIATEKSECGEE